MISIRNIFKRVSVDQVRHEQLFEAERLLAEHMAAAEMHAGLAGVYKCRIQRLRTELAMPVVTNLRVAK